MNTIKITIEYDVEREEFKRLSILTGELRAPLVKDILNKLLMILGDEEKNND